jgi:hypothetical protein
MVNKGFHPNFVIVIMGVKSATNSQIALATERPTVLNRCGSFYLAAAPVRPPAIAAKAGDCCDLPHWLASFKLLSKKLLMLLLRRRDE